MDENIFTPTKSDSIGYSCECKLCHEKIEGDQWYHNRRAEHLRMHIIKQLEETVDSLDRRITDLENRPVRYHIRGPRI